MDNGTMFVSVLVPIGAFAMVVLIVWLVHLANRHKLREQAELQRHFLNKFSTGQELAQFLETPQGQHFLAGMAIGNGSGRPKERIIGSVKTGIVLLALGVGFFALMSLEYDLIYPAIILSALGIGLLISAVVSYWLSKKWNIFEEREIPLEKRADPNI
jgi:hypothetical protein